MCSSTVSDTANRLLKRTNSEGSSSAAEEKPSAVLLFGAVTYRKSAPDFLREKGRFIRGYVLIKSAHGAGKRFSSLRANRRLSFLFAPAAGAAPLPPSADGEFLC